MRPRIAVAVTCLALTVTLAPRVASALDGTSPDRGRTASQSRVAVDQTYPVPGNGTYTVSGHGYGHGRGMSQWGAQGAALAGKTYRQILGFYYPGTEFGTAAKKVRVLISGDTTSDVVVLKRDGLVVRDLGARKTITLPTGPTRWRINPSGTSDVLERWNGSAWVLERNLQGVGEFRAPGPITLVKPSGTTTYRGFLRAAHPTPTSTSRDTVNVVTMDDYLKGVVPSEVYTSWRPAALRAQAVAARTYASYQRADYPDRYYQICDTSSCQVYKGTSAEVASTNDAVDATAREILLYDDEPAFTEFSSSSGGWTAQGAPHGVAVPYLPQQADPWDDVDGNSLHSWKKQLAASTIRSKFPAIGQLLRIRVTARNGGGDWRGRVLTMTLVGRQGSRTMSGDTFRYTFGLPSNWFTFS